MKAPFSSLPALPAAVGIVGGIALGYYGLWWIGISLGLPLFLILYLKNYHYISFFALMLAIGALSAYANRPLELPAEVLSKEVYCKAEVLYNKEKERGREVRMKIMEIDQRVTLHAVVCAYVYDIKLDYEPGSVICSKGIISPIQNEPVIPYDSYHPSWLLKNGIHYTMRCKESTFQLIEEPHGWKSFLNKVRKILFNGIVDSHIQGQYASFLIAAILGDTNYINPNIHEAYQSTGTAHILALSGLHVGILASIITFIFIPFRALRRSFLFSYPLTILLIWTYAFVTGLSPSVVRASIMLTIFLLSSILQRKSQSFNSLCVAIIVILIFSPLSLYTPGFQLSLAAVISILIFIQTIPSRWQRHPFIFYSVTLAVVPISAMLGTGLISAYHFHTFPPLFLLCNIIVGIFIPWVLGIGFILMILNIIGINFVLLGNLGNVLYNIMQWSITKISILDTPSQISYFSSLTFIPYSIFIILLALTLYRIRKSEKWHISAILTFIALIVTAITFNQIHERIPDHEFYITSGSQSSIIIQSNSRPYIIPLVQDGKEAVTLRLQEFLSRHCHESNFEEFPSNKSIGPFIRINDYIVMNNLTFALINSPNLNFFSPISHLDYAIIGPNYKGSIAELKKYLNPDTLLMAGSISINRERRFIRECCDTIPFVTLRYKSFGIKRFD